MSGPLHPELHRHRRLRAALLALAIGTAPSATFATPQTSTEGTGVDPLTVRPAPSEEGALIVPPTLREDSPARLPEGFHLSEPVVVELELTLNEAGDVTEARLVGEAPPELAAAATHAAIRLRFHPATSNGSPVTVRLPFSYRFEPAPASRALLTGRVRQKGTRKPLAGATVQAGDATAETDAQGLFQLELPPGSTALKISAPGHRLLMLTETLAEHQRLEVLYALEPLAVNPYETVVRGDRPRTEVSRVTLHEQELREVPGTMGDPFRVVMLMPGVTTLASGLSYPVVRGVQPSASAFYVDGVRVPFLYHLLAGGAVVHPDFIDTLDFQVGVPSARYGSLLGGAVDAHVSRPREEGLRGTAYVDLINSGAFVEVPFPETGTTVTAAARISYTGLIVTRVANAITGPSSYTTPNGTVIKEPGDPKVYADYWDYQARVEQRVGEGQLRLLVLGSSDAVGLSARIPEQDDGGVGLLFHRLDARGRHPFAGGEAEVGLTLGYDRLGLNFNKSGRDPGSYELSQGSMALRTGYTRELTRGLDVELFGQIERRSASLVASGTFRPQGPIEGRDTYTRPTILATFAGVGAQLTARPSARWTLVPGVRLDSYHGFGLDTYVAVEPRLAVRHALTDTLTLKTGAGLYHQPATVLLPVPAGEMLALERGLQRAVQLSAGAEWRPHPELEVSAEAYFNSLPRTLEFNFEDVVTNARRQGLAAEDVQSHGQSYGVELMVRRPLGRRWFGWLTYGFNQSRRFERYTRMGPNGEELGQAEGYLPYVFEQAHSANAALSYRFEFATVGAVAHFNTGRPESGQFGYRTMRPGTNANGETDWVPVGRDAVDRLPTFFRLDFRASRTLVFDKFLLDIYLDVFNVTARREVLYQEYDYGTSDDLPKGLKKSGFGVPVVLPTLGAKGTF